MMTSTPARFATYTEDGGEWVVRVLADEVRERAGGKFRTVHLLCVREIRRSPRCGSIPEGNEWQSDERIGYEGAAGWTLRYQPADKADVIHVCLWSSQPDILIACDHSWTTPKWGDAKTGTDDVFWTDDGRRYTFDENLTNCAKCLETLADPEKRMKAGTP